MSARETPHPQPLSLKGRGEPEAAASWKSDLLRALAIVAAASALGLATNQLSSKPVPLLAADGPGALPERAERIGAEALKTALAQKNVLLLDVRDEDAFKAAHPAGAYHAPAKDFLEYYQRLSLDVRLPAADFAVLVCESDDCPSADRVAKLLKELKHANVRVFHGGWQAYEKSGLEISGGAP